MKEKSKSGPKMGSNKKGKLDYSQLVSSKMPLRQTLASGLAPACGEYKKSDKKK